MYFNEKIAENRERLKNKRRKLQPLLCREHGINNFVVSKKDIEKVIEYTDQSNVSIAKFKLLSMAKMNSVILSGSFETV